MNDLFDLPVLYKGRQLHFPSQLMQQGYLHQFIVEINGDEIIFEPDEGRQYRATVSPEVADKLKIDIDLIKAIAEALSSF